MQTFLTAFALVFVAELGDKTQLATMLLVAQKKSPAAVFLGAATALMITSLLGVVAGSFLGRVIPPSLVRTGAGVAFLVLGLLLLSGRF